MCDHLVAACLKLKFEYPNTYIKRAVMKIYINILMCF
jgi:hypothetical protein